MIYIMTRNVFLYNGIKFLVFPREVVQISTWRGGSLKSDDVLIIDIKTELKELFRELNFMTTPPVVFIFNDDVGKIGSFLCSFPSYTIKNSISTVEFCNYFLNESLTPDKPLVLSSQELNVLNLSINEACARKNASRLGVPLKQFYQQRKTICRKLGSDNILRLMPYTKYLQYMILFYEEWSRRRA